MKLDYRVKISHIYSEGFRERLVVKMETCFQFCFHFQFLFFIFSFRGFQDRIWLLVFGLNFQFLFSISK